MIGVGLIGAGHFGAVHARAIAQLPDVRLASVCAPSMANAASFAARHGGTPQTDWRRVLDDPAIDAVLVATPHGLHAPMAVAAAQAGRHVLVEKPMAPTVAECLAMEDAARTAGVQLMVGQVMRYVLPCRRAREVLREGRLGRPLFGTSRMVKLWMEGNRRPWHLRADGGGMLMTAGIHALDRLVWLMQADVVSVSAVAGHLFHAQEAADVNLLMLRFDGGALGQLASVGARDATMLNDTEIVCEDGVLRVNPDTGVAIGRHGVWEDVPASAEPDWLLRGVVREWQAFLTAIRNGEPTDATGAQARHLVACIEAAAGSVATGRETTVEADE